MFQRRPRAPDRSFFLFGPRGAALAASARAVRAAAAEEEEEVEEKPAKEKE